MYLSKVSTTYSRLFLKACMSCHIGPGIVARSLANHLNPVASLVCFDNACLQPTPYVMLHTPSHKDQAWQLLQQNGFL